MLRKAIGLLVLALLATPAFAQQRLEGTMWLGTSLMYETPWRSNSNMTFGLGFAPVVEDRDGGGNRTRVGFAAEVNLWQDRQPRGMAFAGRVGFVNGGLYGAPGVYYVSRPARRDAVAFRIGVLAPLGNLDDGDLIPIMPELAVGFRF